MVLAVAARRSSRGDGATVGADAVRGPRAGLWRRLAPFVLFLGIAVAVVGFHMEKYPHLSPIDENAQFDYVRILPHVPAGGTLSQDSLRLTACRKYAPDLSDVGLATYKWPSCTSKTFDPAAYPGGGLSTAGSTAPFYYFVTAALTRPIAYVVDVPLFLLARAVGALWLTALMSVGYLIARRVGAGTMAATAAAIIVGTSSDVVTSASTIGPDTATAAVGGAVILAALSWRSTRSRTLILLGAVLVASVTKLTDFTAVGAALVILLLRLVMDPEARSRRDRVWTLGVVVAALATFVALSAAWFYRPVPGVAPVAGAVPPAPVAPVVVPWADITSNLFFNFFPPNTTNFNATFLEGVFNTHLEELMAGLMMIGVLCCAVALRRAGRASALGWGLLAMVVVGPVALTLLNAHANNMYFPLPSRYGYGILAGFIGAMAWTFRGEVAARALLVVAVASVVSVFV